MIDRSIATIALPPGPTTALEPTINDQHTRRCSVWSGYDTTTLVCRGDIHARLLQVANSELAKERAAKEEAAARASKAEREVDLARARAAVLENKLAVGSRLAIL